MALALAFSVMSGCGGPARVPGTSWPTDELIDGPLREMDANGDELLSVQEISGAPGLLSDFDFIDSDHDDALSREELRARLKAVNETRVGIVAVDVRVSKAGRPLRNTDLVFEPDAWFKGYVAPARGKTDGGGVVRPTTDGSDLPGVRPGFYTVRMEQSNGEEGAFAGWAASSLGSGGYIDFE